MERLIKGFIDVALGAGDPDDGDDSNTDVERSRSTWAEVVSSGQQEQSSHSTAPWSSRKEQSEERIGGEWGTVVGHKKHDQDSSAPPRRQQEEMVEEGRDDGEWETVAPKKKQQSPPRRQHQIPTNNWQEYKWPHGEQKYNNYTLYGVQPEAFREDLEDLSKAATRLWNLDANRLIPEKDYEINCGEGKKVYCKGDMASASLFTWVSDDVFRRPTFSRFCSLLDNYNPYQGYKEEVTSQEKHEQVSFIEEISRTAPIQYLHRILVSKGIASENSEQFKEMLISLWFDIHARGGGQSCSSAFEHVFVGEIKDRGENEVSGFHNWIQFYLEEAKGKVDYQGYIFPRKHGEIPDSETQLLTVQFEWNGVLKSVSSTLIGVSPEFEIALYTLCFFLGSEDNHILLGPYPVNVKCYRQGNNKIGSVFPIAEC